MDETFEKLENWMRKMGLNEKIPNAYEMGRNLIKHLGREM